MDGHIFTVNMFNLYRKFFNCDRNQYHLKVFVHQCTFTNPLFFQLAVPIRQKFWTNSPGVTDKTPFSSPASPVKSKDIEILSTLIIFYF